MIWNLFVNIPVVNSVKINLLKSKNDLTVTWIS